MKRLESAFAIIAPCRVDWTTAGAIREAGKKSILVEAWKIYAHSKEQSHAPFDREKGPMYIREDIYWRNAANIMPGLEDRLA